MLHLEQAVVVEGKYDKIRLESVVDAVIITTNGFSVLKNKDKLALIRYYAKGKGIIILTDSDSAGFRIRNFLKGAVKNGKITNVYIPDVFGREKRKPVASKEGKLGVEGIDAQTLLDAFERAGICSDNKPPKSMDEIITRIDLYECGLTGGDNSSDKRRELLKRLDMPQLLTTTGMLDILNSMMSRSEFIELVNEINPKGE